MKSAFKYLFSVLAVTFCLVLLPISANAQAPFVDGQEYKSTDATMIYVNPDDDCAFIVNEGIWREATYDSSLSFDNAALKIRTALYNRDSSYTGIIAFEKNMLDMNEYNDRGYYYLDEVLNKYLIDDAVYRDDGNPYGGDYLRQTAKVSRSVYPLELSVSKSNAQYCFVKVTYDFSYITTAEQEKMVTDFVELWNYYYVENNSVVQNASTQWEKKYYTVKTIYNFITKNTEYDQEVYYDVNHDKYPVNGARYKASHSAYGAIFGNCEGAYTESFDPSQIQLNKVMRDTQGLYRVQERDNGKAVCEGYTLLFYYMCKYNDIDCKIVTGDYDHELSGKGSDPHAWNMVYLKDSVETSPEWYDIDSTFASQRTQKISDYYTVVDYSYFLRGTQNESFSPKIHQKSDTDYSDLPLSENDFRFEVGDVYDKNDESNYIAIISRRKTSNPEEKYVEDGNYILENYLIINTDGSYFKIVEIDKDENGKEKNIIDPGKGFTYFSTGYYYTCEFIDFAEGIEYETEGQYLLDVGDYSFDLTTVLSNKVYKMNFKIEPLNMSNLSKNYDLNAITVEEPDHSSVVVTANDITLLREFTGTTISLDESNVKIIDSAGARLNSVNKDFIAVLGVQQGDTFVKKDVHSPGTYALRIIYSGNYTGHIDIIIKVTKADLSRYVRTIDLHYGNQVNVSGRTFNFGNESENDYVVLKEGVDFVISNVTPYENVGDKGTFVLTALASSNYLIEGSKVTWNYYVSTPIDLSSAYANYNFPDQTYTGKEVKPTIPNPTISGKEVSLVEGKDYKATYTDNVEVGTATVKIEFIGNYTGSFTKSFKIVKSGGSSGSADNLKLGFMEYNGYTVYVSKIETVNGKTQVTFLTGWLVYKGNKYYFEPKSGKMATGKVNIDGKYYIFSYSDGHMLTGKVRCDGKWYILSKTTGEALTGKVRCDGKYYIMMKTTCEMIYGKVRCDGKYYIMSKSTGEMLYGKLSCDGKMYIMHKTTGEMLYGKVTCDGKTYICSKSDGHIFTNVNVSCDGVKYYCNSSGVATKR